MTSRKAIRSKRPCDYRITQAAVLENRLPKVTLSQVRASEVDTVQSFLGEREARELGVHKKLRQNECA